MAKYNLSNQFKEELFIKRVKALLKKKCLVELKEVKTTRSIDQNALYWLWLTVIEVETGNAKEHMHLLYRYNFLSKADEYITKIIIPSLWSKTKQQLMAFNYFKGLEDFIDLISYSTTDQDTAQFTQYLEKIKAHASAQMSVELLTRDEKNFLEFAKEYQQYR